MIRSGLHIEVRYSFLVLFKRFTEVFVADIFPIYIGWRMEDNYIYDLYMDIESWTLPEDVFGPLSARGVTFGVCSPELFRDLVHFEEKHFSAYPGWVDKYRALKLSDGMLFYFVALLSCLS